MDRPGSAAFRLYHSAHGAQPRILVKDGMALGDVAKKGIQESWTATGELPKDNEAAGVPPRDKRGHDETDIPPKWLPLECRGLPGK